MKTILVLPPRSVGTDFKTARLPMTCIYEIKRKRSIPWSADFRKGYMMRRLCLGSILKIGRRTFPGRKGRGYYRRGRLGELSLATEGTKQRIINPSNRDPPPDWNWSSWTRVKYEKKAKGNQWSKFRSWTSTGLCHGDIDVGTNFQGYFILYI